MYQPQDLTTPTYPVPQKINGRIVSFISAKGAAFVALIGVLSVIAYSTIGAMTSTVEEPLTDYERGTALTELRIERAAVQCEELKAELATLEDDKGLARADLSASEREHYKTLSKAYSESGLVMGAKTAEEKAAIKEKATQNNINSSTTDEELEAMIPATKTTEIQAVNQVHRLIFFLIMPIGIALAIVAEPMGMQSLASMAHDRIQFSKRKRAFLFSRLTFKPEEN